MSTAVHAASASVAEPGDRLALGLLGAGHFAVDLCQAAVPAMLPYFVQYRHLSFASAAGLVVAQTLSSSIIQPLFGFLTDRRPAPWIMPAGVAVAAAGIAAATVLPSYPLIWAAIAVSGIGVAAFHPEGARYARYSSGSREAGGMSIFSVGGNAGFAAGPILMTPILLTTGLSGGWIGMAVPLAVALALLLGMSRIDGHRVAGDARVKAGSNSGRDRWGPFGRLSVALLCRSALFYGLNTFIPLYWISVLHQSKAAAGIALTVLLVTGAAGTLIGGRLGDRYSRRGVAIVACALSVPMMLLTVLAGNPWLTIVALVPLALVAWAPSSVMTVLGQSYLPNRVGTASGVTMGLAFSVGGLMTPVIGYVGDRSGLRVALLAMAIFPLIATVFALSLPKGER